MSLARCQMKKPIRLSKEEFKAKRVAMGLNQSELAKALGANSTTVSRWETGSNAIPPYIYRALADIERELGLQINAPEAAPAPIEVHYTGIASIHHAAELIRAMKSGAELMEFILGQVASGDDWLLKTDKPVLISTGKAIREMMYEVPRNLGRVQKYLEDFVTYVSRDFSETDLGQQRFLEFLLNEQQDDPDEVKKIRKDAMRRFIDKDEVLAELERRKKGGKRKGSN